MSWGGTQFAWTSPELLSLVGAALIFGALFIWNEARAAEPIIPLGLFRNGILSISLVAVFLTSVGMFGTILFIPLFIQGVIGASATTSGNVLTPMMLSFLVGALVSGQLMTRTGHYKVNAMIGTALMLIGMYLLSTMTVATPYSTAIVYMVIMGVGIGSTMPVFSLAAQNAVPYAQLGVATSVLQFSRSIGGAIGTALLGSMLTNQFASNFRATLPAVLSPQQLESLPPHLLQAFQNPQALFAAEAAAGPSPLQTLAQLGPAGQAIAEGLTMAIRLSLAQAISAAFLTGAAIAAIAFVLTLFLRELPLRTSNVAEPAEAAPATARPLVPAERR